MITARNYAAQAEYGLPEFADRMQRLGHNTDADFVRSLVPIIRDAEHFALPDGGVILSSEIRALAGQPIYLPYPAITIEFYEPNVADARKRVILAVQQETHIEIVACFYMGGEWLVGPVGISMPSGDNVVWHDGALACNYQITLPHTAARMTKEAINSDGRLIAFHVAALIEALSCRNVTTEPMERIKVGVNARRARDGKLPLYETKRLVIEVPGPSVDKRGEPIGDRKSVRQHLRRGHIRRLPSGNYWVNACVVGSRERGVIEKSYAVKAA